MSKARRAKSRKNTPKVSKIKENSNMKEQELQDEIHKEGSRNFDKKGKRKCTSKNKKSKRIIILIIQLFFIGVIIFSGIKILGWYKENKANNKILDQISDAVKIETNGINRCSSSRS